MKTTMMAAVAVALVVAGCGGSTVDEFRAAAPSAQGIDIKTRPASKQGLGQPALMPGVTAVTTFLVNGSVALTLGIVASVVATEPASVTEDEVVWGPVTRPLWKNEFTLTMTRGASGFVYEVQGRRKGTGGAFVSFLTGTHRPGLEATGEFVIDWTAMQVLGDPPGTVGQGEISYRRAFRGDVQVDIDFVQTGAPWETVRTDSSYAFSQVERGPGSFEYIVDSDYDPKSPALERLAVMSRWNWDGSGRSDVIGSGGDLTTSFRFSECWDGALNRSYYTDTLGVFPTEGVAASCVFAEPAYTTLGQVR